MPISKVLKSVGKKAKGSRKRKPHMTTKGEKPKRRTIKPRPKGASGKYRW